MATKSAGCRQRGGQGSNNGEATDLDRWLALPSELITAIAHCLETRDDLRRFRQVCNHWRHSTPLSLLHCTPAIHPLLPLNLSEDIEVLSYQIFRGHPLKLVATSVCLLRPIEGPTAQPWLATLEEFNRSKLLLRLPLTRTTLLRNLTPNVVQESKLSNHGYSLLPSNFPTVFDLSKLHVTQLFQGYCLRFRDEMVENKLLAENGLIRKVVLFGNPNTRGGRSSDLTSLDDCQVIVLDGLGKLGWLGLKSREHDKEVTSYRHVQASLRCDDIVCYGNKVYVVDSLGGIHHLKYGSTTLAFAGNPIPQSGCPDYWRKWFVESDGRLYLINRYKHNDKLKFEVYELDVTGVCWNRVMRLGDDRILFVTCDGGFPANVKDFPGWRGNCIVYTSDDVRDFGLAGDWSSKELDIAVYYFDDSKDKLGPNHGYSGHHHITEYENYCKLFWPPPAWVR